MNLFLTADIGLSGFCSCFSYREGRTGHGHSQLTCVRQWESVCTQEGSQAGLGLPPQYCGHPMDCMTTWPGGAGVVGGGVAEALGEA